jgi:hypothetical protein
MDDIKKLTQTLGHASGGMTQNYVKSPTRGEAAKLDAMLLRLEKPPFSLEDCTTYTTVRDLPAIVAVWTTFANISWLSSRVRDDVELIKANGAEALKRLMPVALRDTNQSKRVAGFLLNLYNGERFHFDMCFLGCLDHELFLDCITVLMMDFAPGPEIHDYFERGNIVFEQLAKDWGFKDYTKKE